MMNIRSDKESDTMPRKSYPAKFQYKGEVAERYLERRNGTLKWRREQQIIQRLVGSFPLGSSILDVPIGTGRFLQSYAKGNHSVYGLDISSDMLSQAQDMQGAINNVKGLIQGDAESIPLRDGAVDYVICMRLLNWIPSPIFNDIISEFTRIARKGIIVEVRVSKPIGWLGMIQKTVADPRTNLHRMIHPIYKRVMPNRAPATKALKKNRGNDEIGGYVLHNAEDVSSMIAEHGLVVHDVIEVDKGMDYSHREFKPLLVMHCIKGPL